MEQETINQRQIDGYEQTLYAIKLFNNRSGVGIQQETQWVQCSIQEPFVAVEDTERGIARVEQARSEKVWG
ncbi:MAG: hypothetical protein ACTS2F_10995 [Thainema sp.]